MAEMALQQRRAPWQPSPTDPTEPTISARALAKARGTVEDFARSYMPLLGLPVDDVLCFADSLYFVAGSLYELDELNERGGDRGVAAIPDGPQCAGRRASNARHRLSVLDARTATH